MRSIAAYLGHELRKVERNNRRTERRREPRTAAEARAGT